MKKINGLLTLLTLVLGVSQAFGLQVKWTDYVYDHNGNVTELLDGDTGEIIGEYAYDPYGNTIKIKGEAAYENKVRFSTKEVDASGLYYYGYRYYNPQDGRWLNRDPIGERGGVNLYGMVGNNPQNKFDYLGLKCCCGGKYLPSNRCCEGGKKSKMRDATIDITVGHSHEDGGISEGLLDAIKDSDADSMACVTCFQQDTNELIDNNYPNEDRLNELLYPGKGNNFRDQLNKEIEAARKEAKSKCSQACIERVKIKITAHDVDGENELKRIFGSHSKIINVPCDKSLCSSRGGVEKK